MPRATAFSVGYAPMCCDHRRLRSVSVVSSNAPAAIRRQPDIFRGSFDVAANDRRVPAVLA